MLYVSEVSIHVNIQVTMGSVGTAIKVYVIVTTIHVKAGEKPTPETYMYSSLNTVALLLC
jgi:hypothetical protein